MAVGKKVGEAYVDVEGDYRDIADNGARKIEEAFNKAGRDVDVSESLSKSFSEAGEQAGEVFTRDATGRIRNSKGRYVKAGSVAAHQIVEGVRKGVKESNSKDRDSGGGILGGIFGKLDGKFGGAADKITGQIKKLLDPKKLVKLGATGLVDLFTKTFSYGGIAGVIFQATSALLSFSGTLLTIPGIIGAAALAGGTLAIAFSGIGDAITAVASGDLKKIDAALKGLAPAAKDFVLEFRGIIPVFKDIKNQVQQNFFEQFKGQATEVVKNLGFTFGKGFSTLATSLGVLVKTVLNKLSSDRAAHFFDRLFETADNLVKNVGPPLLNLLSSFAGAFEKTLPFVDKLFEGLGGGLDKFSAFIDEKVADGSFENFLTSAFNTAGLLGDAIFAVIDLLKSMFADSNETGNEFLETFTKAIKELTDYFNSKPGKEALETLVFLGKLMGGVVITLIHATLGWLTAINRVWQAIKNVYQTFKAALGLYEKITGAASGIGNAFAIGARALPGFAVGGVVTRPTIAQVGEKGAEAIVPLTNPKRAREVMEEAGLVSIAAGMGSSDGMTVVVYLGTEQITDILDSRVEKGLQRTARSITRGDRPD
jgi:hypothetical protein